MDEIKFKIGEQEFLIKQTFRALMMYEEMTGKSYEADDKMNTQFKMLYCILKAANRETFKYNYDEFIDTLDENQKSIEDFFKYLTDINTPKPDKKKVTKQRV
jgi:hypothetical protein